MRRYGFAALLLLIAHSPLQKTMTYSDTWAVIKDFQSLIGALVSLTAVLGAIGGIVLKVRLDEHIAERKLRESRRATASSLSSLIRIESSFPKTSLLRVPSEPDVQALLTATASDGPGLISYIDYLLKLTTTLSVFPRPISERAHFLSWISMRIAVALSDVHKTGEPGRTATAQRYVPELRMLLIAALVVIDELADELLCYETSTDEYERDWKDSGRNGSRYRGVRSCQFDMKALNTRIWEVSLKPSAGLQTAVAIGRSPRIWLESLLEKVRLRVGRNRKRTEEPLQAIYDYCQKLPSGSPERRVLERLVVAIWKRGEDRIDESDVLSLDVRTLELVSDLGEQAARSWRL